jgi:hypothetical protein
VKQVHIVTLTIETNDIDDSKIDIAKHFKFYNVFQLNDTQAKIIKCEVK